MMASCFYRWFPSVTVSFISCSASFLDELTEYDEVVQLDFEVCLYRHRKASRSKIQSLMR